jgi:hypothetical protein
MIETDQDSRERLESIIRQEGKTWGVASDIREEANATARQILNPIEEGHLADGPLTARISFDKVSFVMDIHYSGNQFRLPANRPHSDENLLEEQPMARGLSGFLAEVHPEQRCSWVDNERCHIQLVFKL